MTTETVARLGGRIRSTLVRKSPEILTGIGIAGMITTVVLAVKETPKAIRLMDEAANEKNAELTPVEKIQASWKCYIPAAIVGGISIACLISANSVNAKRNAALAAAYTLSDSALRDYKRKAIEVVGEKKEAEIRDKVAEEKVKTNPVSKNEIYITERGNTLCLDTISGRYFKSDIETIKKVQNELNKRILHEMYLSLNEFYDELGLAHTAIGDDLGWKSDDLIDIDFSAQLAEDGTPCIVLDYRVAPEYGYDRLS